MRDVSHKQRIMGMQCDSSTRADFLIQRNSFLLSDSSNETTCLEYFLGTLPSTTP